VNSGVVEAGFRRVGRPAAAYPQLAAQPPRALAQLE
jgi:hypothetical protein